MLLESRLSSTTRTKKLDLTINGAKKYHERKKKQEKIEKAMADLF